MNQVLLLNLTYEPLRVISWRRAIRLLTLGKVEVLEESDAEVRSMTFVIRLPSVVRLLRLVRRGPRPVRFSRQNIYVRDGFRCQYCGRRPPVEDLTYDHLLPRAQGGRTDWENIVTACVECNARKGGRTPDQARMRPLRPPLRPAWLPAVQITVSWRNAPDAWRDYLYWTVSLDGDAVSR